MYETKNFSTPREFVEFNEEFIYSNPMQNATLINAIEEIANNNWAPDKAFNLIGGKNNRLLVLIIEGYCLIYCDQHDPAFLEILSSELPFEKLTDFAFAGDKETIEKLLQLNGLDYSIEKHLITYRCEKLNPDFKFATGQMRFVRPSDVSQLTTLSIKFSEEYNGITHTFADMKLAVHNEMMSRVLYVWEDTVICAMALEMNRQTFDYPEIGKLYTIPDQRCMGYSSSLLYKLTEQILSKHLFCMLYTNGENSASNITCLKVGYVPVGNYVRVRLT